jgi:hypothetical protein
MDYVTSASHIHYGLIRKKIMKLAYQFEKELTESILTPVGCEWRTS